MCNLTSLLFAWRRPSSLPQITSKAHQLTPVRPDRDDFIRLNEENIDPEMKDNFAKRPYGDSQYHTEGSVNSRHTPYDILSAI